MKFTTIKTVKKAIGLMALSWLFSSATIASTVSMTNDQLEQFNQLSVTLNTIFQVNGDDDGDGLFDFTSTIILLGQPNGSSYTSDIGNEYIPPLDWSAHDTFMQTVTNRDQNNSWVFAFSLFDGEVTRTTSAITVSHSASQIFSIDLSSDVDGFNSSNIEQVALTLSADNLPMQDGSSVAEYAVDYQLSEVPIPGSSWLFISSVIGLIIAKNRPFLQPVVS